MRARNSRHTSRIQSKARLKIVNVVATASINQTINLDQLSDEGGFRYDLAVYHCAYLKDHLTKGKVSIFATGKLISIGTKNPRDATSDLKHAVQKLAELGLAKSIEIRPKIQNIVARLELGFRVDLEVLAKDLRAIYEPGQFPAVMYWPARLNGGVVSIFSSGKVIVSGLKNTGSVRTAEQVLDEVLLTSRTREGVREASTEREASARC